MMGSILLSRVLGMGREMVLAYAGGTSGEVDAYKAAFLLPDILNHVLAGGFLSITFIPIYARYLAAGNEAEGDRVASLVLTVTAVLAGALAVVQWWLAPVLVPWAFPRIAPSLQVDVVRLTRIVLLAQLFLIPGGVLLALQMARGRFFLPACAPLVYNAGIILGGLLLGPSLGMEGFSWGVVAGAFVGNFALQAWGAHRLGFRFRPCWAIRHPDLRAYVLLTLPLALGLTMTFSTELFFKIFGGRLPAGAIASLDFALRLMLVLVAVFGQAAGTASFPFLARLAAEGRMQELTELLDTTLRRFLVPVVLGAAFLAVLAPEIVALVYRRGSFTDESVMATAEALRGFLLGAPAWAASTIVVRGWFARRNTLTPALVSTVGVLLALPLYLLFTRWWGALGVALGASGAMWLQAAFLYGFWCVRTSNRGAARVGLGLAGAAALGILLGTAAAALRLGLAAIGLDSGTQAGSLGITGLSAVLFGSGVFVLAPVFGLSELRSILRCLASGPARRMVAPASHEHAGRFWERPKSERHVFAQERKSEEEK